MPAVEAQPLPETIPRISFIFPSKVSGFYPLEDIYVARYAVHLAGMNNKKGTVIYVKNT